MELEKLDYTRNAMQNVKRRFFALRNGVLADVLRRSGSPYRIIFGLNVPQIKEVAAVFGYDRDLAEKLWADTSTRESRLMAPMLVNPEEFTDVEAKEWVNGAQAIAEECDMLCMGLLRRLPYRRSLAGELTDSACAVSRYVGLRLLFADVSQDPARCALLANAELERGHPFTRSIARQLAQEASMW